MKLSNIFKRDKSFYTSKINPIKDYLKINSKVLALMNKIKNPEERLRKYIKDENRFKNPTVKFYERDLKGIRVEKSLGLLNYIASVKQKGDIIVPSFTVYFSKDKKRSLHAEFININVKKRSENKKLAFKFKMAGDMTKSTYHNVIQKVMKIFNNSLSGAYASMGTILYNLSAHYTLTSITRAVSGIGNVLSESIISGNRHYRDPDITFNHIATIVSTMDEREIRDTVLKYRLKIPTPQETMNCILKSTSKYWRNLEKEAIIYEYLTKLTGIERAYVTYHNDLYHFRKHNEDITRSLMNDLLRKHLEDIPMDKCDAIISNSEEWAVNLAVHANTKLLMGISKDKFTLEHKQHIASFIINLNNVFTEYEDLIKAFLITEVFPPSLAYIKDMVRESIVLSDTDSTCATYEEWVEWYYGKVTFMEEAVTLTASIMTIVTQSTDHYIKMFAANMNINPEEAKHLAMKNEFFWSVFVNTNVSKHYYATVNVQEGNVYQVSDPMKNLEKKGVNLIVPNVYGPIRELSEKMMVGIMELVRTNKQIPLQHFIDMVLDAEMMILNKIKDGSPDVLKLEKIKEPAGYAKGPSDSPYMHYMLWQDVFSSRYGNAPDPQYMAVKLPTTVTSKRSMALVLDNMPNQEFADDVRRFLGKVKKDKVTTFRLPLIIVYNNGIPKEILSMIDYKRVIKDNVKVLYMILETLGYYVKTDSTLLEELSDYDLTNITE